MMDIIVEVTEQIGKGKYRVVFSNGISCALYAKELKQYGILEGESLTEASFQDLMSQVLIPRAKKRAMHILEKMDRSEAKLREKLKEGEYPEICIDVAINYVKSYHYLDDERYAHTMVRNHCRHLSKRQLLQKLMQRGIAGDVAQRAIEDEFVSDEQHQILDLLHKRKFPFENYDEKEFRRNYEYLARRGFSGSDIVRGLRSDGNMDEME